MAGGPSPAHPLALGRKELLELSSGRPAGGGERRRQLGGPLSSICQLGGYNIPSAADSLGGTL